MANPLRPGPSIAAAVAAILLASGGTPSLASSGTPSLASSGGAPAPADGVFAVPTAPDLLPSSAAGPLPTGDAGPATGLAPNTLQPPVGGALVGQPTTIRGRLRPGDVNCPLLLEYLDPRRGWQIAARGTTNSTGAFVVVLRPQHIGRFIFRATTASPAVGTATAPVPIEIYRRVVATIFGSGDYGNRTACGQALTPTLLGVAHRTLPCGTLVDIAYGRLQITVPVVDRGPYISGVTYDLTTATAAALGIDQTAQIGAVALRTPAPPAR